MNVYRKPTLVRMSVLFATVVGAVPADPTTVVCKYLDTTGTIQTIGATKDSVGNYHADLTPTVNGVYTYHWEGLGAVVAADQNQFEIRGDF